MSTTPVLERIPLIQRILTFASRSLSHSLTLSDTTSSWSATLRSYGGPILGAIATTHFNPPGRRAPLRDSLAHLACVVASRDVAWPVVLLWEQWMDKCTVPRQRASAFATHGLQLFNLIHVLCDFSHLRLKVGVARQEQQQQEQQAANDDDADGDNNNNNNNNETDPNISITDCGDLDDGAIDIIQQYHMQPITRQMRAITVKAQKSAVDNRSFKQRLRERMSLLQLVIDMSRRKPRREFFISVSASALSVAIQTGATCQFCEMLVRAFVLAAPRGRQRGREGDDDVGAQNNNNEEEEEDDDDFKPLLHEEQDAAAHAQQQRPTGLDLHAQVPVAEGESHTNKELMSILTKAAFFHRGDIIRMLISVSSELGVTPPLSIAAEDNRQEEEEGPRTNNKALDAALRSCSKETLLAVLELRQGGRWPTTMAQPAVLIAVNEVTRLQRTASSAALRRALLEFQAFALQQLAKQFGYHFFDLLGAMATFKEFATQCSVAVLNDVLTRDKEFSTELKKHVSIAALTAIYDEQCRAGICPKLIALLDGNFMYYGNYSPFFASLNLKRPPVTTNLGTFTKECTRLIEIGFAEHSGWVLDPWKGDVAGRGKPSGTDETLLHRVVNLICARRCGVDLLRLILSTAKKATETARPAANFLQWAQLPRADGKQALSVLLEIQKAEGLSGTNRGTLSQAVEIMTKEFGIVERKKDY